MTRESHAELRTTLIVVGRGTAQFEDASLPKELYRDGSFRSRLFEAYEDGERIDALFRYSNRARHLVWHDRAINEEPVETAAVPAKQRRTEGEWVNGIYFTARAITTFATAHTIAERTGAANIIITGDSGYGKTSMVKAFAEATGRRFIRKNCAMVMTPEEWFGTREAIDGTTVFQRSELLQLIEEGNAVILFDEFNRLEAWLANSLFSLLDDDRETWVHGEHIKCGPNVVFAATINSGYRFVGTFEMDAALRNRMGLYFEVGALPISTEVELLTGRTGISTHDAKKIVRVFTTLRKSDNLNELDIDFTTRASLNVAFAAAAGMPLRLAFDATLVLATAERKGLVDVLNSMLGPVDEAYDMRF